jgi:hypothetical protein
MTLDRHARTMLPIPDRPVPGLTTYDAKDPDTAFPPIEPLLPPARFTGRINGVQIDLGDDDNDHFIDPDERLRVAMARQ